jgi:nicotinamidase-related amidase
MVTEMAPRKPVVIILDMARGYGWEPGSFGYDMVARVRRLKDAAHAAGVPVVHVHSMRRPTDNLPGDVRMLAGTDALDVIPELQPVDRDTMVYKRYLSGFSHNDLDYTLRTMGCDMVIIAGASTDNTVLWTSADAYQNRYRVTVVEDCCMTHRPADHPHLHNCALEIIRKVLHSEVIPLDEVIRRYLQPQQVTAGSG